LAESDAAAHQEKNINIRALRIDLHMEQFSFFNNASSVVDAENSIINTGWSAINLVRSND
jgi:hypothetical protein